MLIGTYVDTDFLKYPFQENNFFSYEFLKTYTESTLNIYNTSILYFLSFSSIKSII